MGSWWGEEQVNRSEQINVEPGFNSVSITRT